MEGNAVENKKYVIISGNNNEILVMGVFEGYMGKWVIVKRNENEKVAIHEDSIKIIRYFGEPTQAMTDYMYHSNALIVKDDGPQATSLSVEKQTSSSTMSDEKRVEAIRNVGELIKNIVNDGPKGIEQTKGVSIFDLPRNVKLPPTIGEEELQKVEELIENDKSQSLSDDDIASSDDDIFIATPKASIESDPVEEHNDNQ